MYGVKYGARTSYTVAGAIFGMVKSDWYFFWEDTTITIDNRMKDTTLIIKEEMKSPSEKAW